MFIPTEFLPCALVSNCFLVTIVLICEKCSFAYINRTFLSWLHTCRERTELKWNIYMIRVLPNRNEREFQTFYIRACSSTDSARWDWGIMSALHEWEIWLRSNEGISLIKIHSHTGFYFLSCDVFFQYISSITVYFYLKYNELFFYSKSRRSRITAIKTF